MTNDTTSPSTRGIDVIEPEPAAGAIMAPACTIAHPLALLLGWWPIVICGGWRQGSLLRREHER